jgi:two-component system OmpR family response regulator/two-component system response regulator RstA
MSKADADNQGMLRVLIVEDDPGMNEYIGDILSQKGFQVSSAFDGFAGLDSIRSATPHVVILDIFMPEKDGLEMLVELRRFAGGLPVLVISGKQHLLSGCSMSLAKQLGANDVLAKPFTPKALLERVTALANATSTKGRRDGAGPLPNPHNFPHLS